MKFTCEEWHLARQSLCDRVIDYFIDRQGIEAIYLQGSIAEGSADEWSDLDFRVVVKPKFYQQYLSERFTAPQQWGEWLYNEWAGRSWVCVSHFEPFCKVDILYFQPEQLEPSPWFALPTQIIYDPKGLVQQVIQDSQNIEPIAIKTEEISRLISKGLAYAEEIYRRVMRGELFYAQSQLDSLRWVSIQLDDYLHQTSLSSGFGSLSHFEKRGSQSVTEAIQFSYCNSEKQSILKALSKLLKSYRTQVMQLYQTFSLNRDRKIDLHWIDRIIQLCLQ